MRPGRRLLRAVLPLLVGGALMAVVPAVEAASLPDGRAYEQISPIDKYGYGVGGNLRNQIDLVVSPDGNRIFYRNNFPIPPTEGGSETFIAAERGGSGWINQGIGPTPGTNMLGLGLPGAAANPTIVAPDALTTVYYNWTTAPTGSIWISRADGSRQLIKHSPLAAMEDSAFDDRYPLARTISDDGKHVVVESSERFGPGADVPGTTRLLYEWIDDGAAGTWRLVNRSNDDPDAIVGSGDATIGGVGLIERTGQFGTEGGNRISNDGQVIFFQSPGPPSYLEVGGGLFARIGGAHTVELSTPAPGHTPSGPVGVRYLHAAEDGGVVYFYADTDLVDGAPSTGGVYRRDVTDGSVPEFLLATTGDMPTLISSPKGDTAIVKANHDLYFVDASGAVETLFTDTFSSTELSLEGCSTADVTPDGRYFVFTKNGIFRYDTLTGDLDTIIDQNNLDSMLTATSCSQMTTRRRVMSDDGKTVVFASLAALVPEDSNDESDVYRWKEGSGIALISPGVGSSSDNQAMDPSGQNIYFTTKNPLLIQDGDREADVYTARVGGGFPTSPPAKSCDGDSCQGDRALSPIGPAYGSAGFRGSGNVKPGHSTKPGRSAAMKTPRLPVRVASHHTEKRRAFSFSLR